MEIRDGRPRLVPLARPGIGLETEEARLLGVDEAFGPAHQGITMGFDPREVGERFPLGIAQRLIDAAGMGIAMHGNNLPREGQGFIAQQRQEIAIAAVAEALGKMPETRIGLKEQHHAGQFLALGQGKLSLSQAWTTGMR